IGTDGTTSFGNTGPGILLADGTSGTMIGGSTAGARNIISGNSGSAIEMTGNGTTNNTVLGNYIGTDSAGTTALQNGVGVQIENGASNNTIGGIHTSGAGLVNEWRGNGDGVESIAGNDLSFPNGVGYTTGKLGQALNFDGVDQYATVADSSQFALGAGPFSFSVWTRTVGGRNVNEHVLSRGETWAGGDDFVLLITGLPGAGGSTFPRGRVVFQYSTYGANDLSSTTSIDDGQWHLITITQTGAGAGTAKLYVDGVLEDVKSGNTLIPSSAPFYVGGAFNVGDSTPVSFNGGIDDLRFYRRALSASDVAELYTSPEGPLGSGNLISGNAGDGVNISGSGTSGNAVLGNYIGTNGTGTAALGNTQGVRIADGAQNNTVGGTSAGAGNVVSGNANYGVYLLDSGTQNNTVSGNYIGSNAAGTNSVGNQVGVVLTIGASNNTIGGSAAGAGNVISGNTGISAVYLSSSGTNNNTIAGNLIGTTATGNAPLSNAGTGISIVSGASNNTIGGTTAGARNILSGNAGAGVDIRHSGTTNNSVLGNYVGTDITGMTAMPNLTGGIHVADLAAGNIIGGSASGAGNLISGHAGSGEPGSAVIVTDGATGTLVEGNRIGTDATGNAAIPNGMGIFIHHGSPNSIVRGNVISGNETGIWISDPGTTNTWVTGNRIGVNQAATGALGNTIGVFNIDSANNTIVGTNGDGTGDATEGNVISGNDLGVVAGGISDLIVAGNMVGSDLTGFTAIPNNTGVQLSNALHVTIGGTSSVQRNVISGNTANGVFIYNGSTGTTVLGNYIGVNAAGTAALGNGVYGVRVLDSTSNTVGGTSAGARNVISGNGGDGVNITGATALNNVIQGNYIGTNAAGTAAIGNHAAGVVSQLAGLTLIDRNVISGNLGNGVSLLNNNSSGNSTLTRNYIGTNAAGTAALGNSFGVVVVASPANTIGAAGAGNVISGNNYYGIEIVGTNAAGNTLSENNVIRGNTIGANATGTAAIPNGGAGVAAGVRIESSEYVTVGGTGVGEGNLISGNNGDGISLAYGRYTTIQGNRIGTNSAGTSAIANTTGISILSGSRDNTIGGTTSSARNVISGNSGDGVSISGSNLRDDAIWWGANGSANDLSGNGLNGTLQNGATFGTGRGTSPAFQFNGIDQYVSVANNALLNPTTAMSVSAWFTASVTSGYQSLINKINHLGGTADDSYAVMLEPDGKVRWQVDTNNGDFILQFTPAVDLRDGQFHHVAATYDGALMKLYVDGLLAASRAATGTIVTTTTPLFLGAFLSGGSPAGFLNGKLEDAAIFGRSLSASEVARIHQVGGGSLAGNDMQGNYIGTNAAGTAALANGTYGVRITASYGNLIGGSTAGAGNLISGNALDGISLNSAVSTRISGNLLGTNALGSASVPNLGGIVASNGSSYLTIGGTTAAERNIISGNIGGGVDIQGGDLISLTGNYAGLDATGMVAVPNGNQAFFVRANSTNVTIGGSNINQRNYVAGNLGGGAYVAAESATVSGNYFGVNITGMTAVPNRDFDVLVDNSALPNPSILIGGPTPVAGAGVGNLFAGMVWMYRGHATIQGNTFGLGADGTTPLGRELIGDEGGPATYAGSGVHIFSTSAPTTIGGTTAGARNVFGGTGIANRFFNGPSHIHVFRDASAGNIIQGNYIGTDITGTVDTSTAERAIELDTQNNIVGGSAPGAGNVIAGTFRGIEVNKAGNVIEGNTIGLGADGQSVIGHDWSGVFDRFGQTTIRNNVLVGKGSLIPTVGIYLAGAGSTVVGNLIGSNATGTLSAGHNTGITVDASAAGNLIGGFLPGEGNRILNSATSGIRFEGISGTTNTATSNTFAGNVLLGIDAGPIGVTLNDPSESDGVLNAPIVTNATFSGGDLTLEGFVEAGKTVQFFVSSPTAGGIGQGELLIATLTEGSVSDLDGSTGSYGPVVAGRTVSTGVVTASRFRFTIPAPSRVTHGTPLTAVALGSTSEFSPILLAGEVGSQIAPEISLSQTTVAILTGDSVSIDGSFFDPDSTTWTATVNYGDGGGVQSLALNSDNTFRLSHTYQVAGSYSIVVEIRDNSLVSTTRTIPVNVQNEAPSASFDGFTITSPGLEGQAVILSGEFQDTSGAHIARIEWGDGTISSVSIPSGVTTFTATHTYTDDTNEDGTATPADVYRVTVTITDEGGLSDTTPLGLFLEEVRNVRPAALDVGFSSTSVVEGGVVSLSGTFTDPGVNDVHTMRINWGDGTTQLVTLPIGARSFSGLTHQYVDDPEAGPDNYIVTIEIADDDEPLLPAVLTQSVSVTNAVPSSVTLGASSTSILEDGSITLSGAFVDAGVNDSHSVTINWGDGSSPTILNLAAGISAFAGITHRYLDNRNPVAAYVVTVEVSDNDQPAAYGSAVLSVQVNNIAPVLNSTVLSRNGVVLPAGAILNEGDTLTVSGNFTDESAVDSHTVRIFWGDGTDSYAVVDSLTRTFTAIHTIVDNGEFAIGVSPGAGPNPVTYWMSEILVTVMDDDGASASATILQQVNNLAPHVAAVPDASNADPNLVLLNAQVNDPGIADIVTVIWTAEVVGSSLPIQTGSGYAFTVNRSAAPSAVWTVRVIATDDDGGSAMFETALLVGTSGSDVLEISDQTFTQAGSDTLIVMGFDGNDIIDGSRVSSTS
ncbi:MAG: hypothetical protein JNM43_28575, partial [Planctomycetaceae bacterium]|nr:hypothetical protein [Planctomycetaceae bacterium]